MSVATIEALGDGALLIRLGDCIDPALNRAAICLSEALNSAGLAGISDVAPAYASVCVRYDIAAWFDPESRQGAFERLAARLRPIVDAAADAGSAGTMLALVEIPVCYGADHGPDIDAVAAHAGLDVDSVVQRHAAAEYRVAMLGFMPGFAYLLGLDPSLHTPRRPTPRTRVPGGSVAIGGGQTGIYPRELPGGWQLIGRTPLQLFDPARSEPALLKPGQRVRFRPIDAAEFASSRR